MYIKVSVTTKIEEVIHMKPADNILQIVGNETRRRILALLSEEPHYISQIAKKLDVTQPAILKHLSLLQKAGLIESSLRKNPLGAARKYYTIRDSVGIEIAINPNQFTVTRNSQRMSCLKQVETERIIEQLTEEINRAKDLAEKAAKARKLIELAGALLACENHEAGNQNCRNCRQVASLRKEVSQIIIHVSGGEIESGLQRLTETINHLMSNFLPT